MRANGILMVLVASCGVEQAVNDSYDLLSTCPAGFVFNGTTCVPTGCPAGFVLDGVACVCPEGTVLEDDVCVAEGPALCPATQSCFDLGDGDGVCALPSGEIPPGSPSCTTAECGGDELCVTASGVEGAWCLALCDPDAGPEQPKPDFTVGSASGSIAIDDDGIRTYIYDGDEYFSVLEVALREVGSDSSCSIALDPAFVTFGTKSTTTRTFATVTMDLGASILLDDGCGWDDDYILSELEGHTVTVGFTQARFEEDRPYLDVYYPESNTTVVGGGIAFAIDASGVVDEDQTVEPVGGVFVPGVYQW